MQFSSSMLGPYAERAKLAPPGLEGKVTEVLGMLIAGSARDAAVVQSPTLRSSASLPMLL